MHCGSVGLNEVLPYGEAIAAKLRALRVQRDLDQATLALRMKKLGYNWHRQTVGQVETGKRRVTVDELLGLCIALGASLPDTTAPLRNSADVSFPNGMTLPASLVSSMAGFGTSLPWLGWDDDGTPRLPPVELLQEIGKNDHTADVRDEMAGLHRSSFSLDVSPVDVVDSIIGTAHALLEEAEDEAARSRAAALIEELESPEGRKKLLREVRDGIYQRHADWDGEE